MGVGSIVSGVTESNTSISTNAAQKLPAILPNIIARHPKANGDYLSRQFYNELNRWTHVQRNPFQIPDRVLKHTKQIKPRAKKATAQSEYIIIHLYKMFIIIYMYTFASKSPLLATRTSNDVVRSFASNLSHSLWQPATNVYAMPKVAVLSSRLSKSVRRFAITTTSSTESILFMFLP